MNYQIDLFLSFSFRAKIYYVELRNVGKLNNNICTTRNLIVKFGKRADRDRCRCTHERWWIVTFDY